MVYKIQPKIKYENGKYYYKVIYTHDRFPSYELKLNSKVIYNYDASSNSPLLLGNPVPESGDTGWKEV